MADAYLNLDNISFPITRKRSIESAFFQEFEIPLVRNVRNKEFTDKKDEEEEL